MAVSPKTAPATNEAGFTLIEVLSVMAIISLLIGLVALNWPQPKPALAQQMQRFSFETNAFFQAGVIAGDMRAIGFGSDGYELYRFDGENWNSTQNTRWDEPYKLTLIQDSEKVKLPKTPVPIIIFEPTGVVPDFKLSIGDGRLNYLVQSTETGQVVVDAR